MKRTVLSIALFFSVWAPSVSIVNAQALTTLDLIKNAANIAQSVQSDSLLNYSAEYFDSTNWHSGATDGLFGPFLAAQPIEPNRSVVCLVSESFFEMVCVYYDNQKPYGYVAAAIEPGNEFTAPAIAATYKPLSPQPLKQNSTFQFHQGSLPLDDGTSITAYVIAKVKP